MWQIHEWKVLITSTITIFSVCMSRKSRESNLEWSKPWTSDWACRRCQLKFPRSVRYSTSADREWDLSRRRRLSDRANYRNRAEREASASPTTCPWREDTWCHRRKASGKSSARRSRNQWPTVESRSSRRFRRRPSLTFHRSLFCRRLTRFQPKSKQLNFETDNHIVHIMDSDKTLGSVQLLIPCY